MEALKSILPTEIRKPLNVFEFLARNNRYTSFPNLFVDLRIYFTAPAVTTYLENGVFLCPN